MLLLQLAVRVHHAFDSTETCVGAHVFVCEFERGEMNLIPCMVLLFSILSTVDVVVVVSRYSFHSSL